MGILSAASRRWLGWAALCLALSALASRLWSPIGTYDEGILLANADFVRQGALPHRDFYTNYPPGIFFLIAGLWEVFGVSIVGERVLGLLLHVATAIFAGKLAGRLRDGGFSFLAASAVLFWAAALGNAPRAWLAAMAAALAFAWCLWSALASRRPRWWFLAGLALGAVGAFRHDLFGSIGLVGGALALGRWFATRARPESSWFPRLLLLAAGAGLVLVPVWGPVLAAAGPERVVLDLFVEQSRVIEARALPLFQKVGLRGYQWMFLLEVAAPIVAAWLLVRRGWSVGAPIVGGLALAVLPAAAGRTDAVHVIGCAAPALILFTALGLERLERARTARARWAIAAVLLGALVVPAPRFLSLRLPRGEVVGLEPSRYGNVLESAERRAGREVVLRYIRERTRPDDRIFVGTRGHRVVFANELDLYFLGDRRGATRWMQFDPNLTNRLDVQREITADFERTRAPVVVLCDCCYRDEGNGNDVPGAELLDEYLAAHYEAEIESGPYLVLRRRE